MFRSGPVIVSWVYIQYIDMSDVYVLYSVQYTRKVLTASTETRPEKGFSSIVHICHCALQWLCVVLYSVLVFCARVVCVCTVVPCKGFRMSAYTNTFTIEF